MMDKSHNNAIFPLEFFGKFHAQIKKTAHALLGIVRYNVGGRRSDGERERAKGVGFSFRVWV